MSNAALHETIRSTLAQRAGITGANTGAIVDDFANGVANTVANNANPDSVTASAKAVAEAAIVTWRQVAERLEPVIGEGGVDVLFRRALHLTSKTFPWLAVSAHDDTHTALLANFMARIADRDDETAFAASHALLATFTDLLAGLIGDSLTGRLLAPVWVSPAAASEQENAP